MSSRRHLMIFAGVLLVLVAGLSGIAQVRTFRLVTDEMLSNPNPADWLHWRRTSEAWGYSPLNQITVQNAPQLRLAWSWALAEGSQETTPLVYDGVMYIANPGGLIHALDAATGELIWEYDRGESSPAPPPGPAPSGGGPTGFGRTFREGASPEVERERTAYTRLVAENRAGRGSVMRNLAIYQDKIFVNTRDAHIVALDAQSGKVVWDTAIADPAGKRYSFTSGSIVADGKVIAGLGGCSRYVSDGCYIVALDAGSGREVWRTSTIAKPGEPGGDTWGGLPLMFRAGGESWIPGSYDPKLKLLYWGTAQAKPWAQFQRGTDGEALYTNSTLALDVTTGKLRWHFQHFPGESHDMDEVFERILIDYDGRSSVFSMGKLGILWENDRRTGRFIKANDLGYQTLVDLNRQTGRLNYRPGMLQVAGREIDWCPGTAGFKSWRAMAYHPETEAFYLPLNLHCEIASFGPTEQREGATGGSPHRQSMHVHPKSPDKLGEFLAMSMRTGKVLWQHRVRTPFNSAALTTGGGLAIAGDWDRYVYVYNAKTGDILFQTRLPTSIQGFPITYAVNGKQYIAIPVGWSGNAANWQMIVPQELTPEKKRPKTGNSVFVFALPD